MTKVSLLVGVLAMIEVLSPSIARTEPLCVGPDSDSADREGADRMEKLFTDGEVERAWRSFGPNAEVGKSKSKLGPVVENAFIIYNGFEMQRAYRFRTELELAEKTGAAPSDIAARRKAFEKAREVFCKDAGLGFIPEFRLDFDKR